MKEDKFMRLAIEDAKKHRHHFGAVVVRNGKVIAKAGKRPKGDPRYHAETQALITATNRLKTRDLRGCTLYSTCEPCPMCFYMAWVTNIPKIVYGATLKDCFKYGFKEMNIGDKVLNHRSGNKIKLRGKFLREECLKLFKR
jgi:tRNA(Arg) A34 adenosine deaminase TadA